MNIRSNIRHLWHDALSGNVRAIDPAHQIGFATKDRGLDEMADHVLAGHVQAAIARLPKHLQAWGYLCWAPPTNCPPGLFEQIHARLIEGYNNDRARAKYGSRIERAAEVAIIRMVEQERTLAVSNLSQAQCARHLGVDPADYRRAGYAAMVSDMMQILSEWSDRALAPIKKIKYRELGELETKQIPTPRRAVTVA